MSHPTTDAILVESDGPVRIVTLNRPDSRNAIVQDVKDALLRIWDDLADDLDVRAVVLTGAGSAFSAGGDIANFPNVAADGDYRRRVRLRNGRKIIDSLTNFPLPLVVAVNGPAVGLGCSIASLGDVIYASTNAFFADPHVSIGLVAGDGGAATWPLMMSLARAKEYILTGDRIPADEAYRLGLVNHVVPPEELLPSALAMAHRLAAQPPGGAGDQACAQPAHPACRVRGTGRRHDSRERIVPDRRAPGSGPGLPRPLEQGVHESMTSHATADETTGEPLVKYEVNDGVALITWNRPHRRNAWTPAMEAEYFGLLRAAAADGDVRAIVVTGAGGNFCPGMDVAVLLDAANGSNASNPEQREPQTLAMTIPKPIIAAIEGACAGTGFIRPASPTSASRHPTPRSPPRSSGGASWPNTACPSCCRRWWAPPTPWTPSCPAASSGAARPRGWVSSGFRRTCSTTRWPTRAIWPPAPRHRPSRSPRCRCTANCGRRSSRPGSQR